MSERDDALWWTDLFRASLSQTDDMALAVAVADHAYANAAALGLDAQGNWHGPTPPGPGWALLHEGPRHGKVWKKPGGTRDRAPGGPSVAVVGGGPAGLFATYLLNQRCPQARVTLFEATGRLGGKILTGAFEDGTPYERGVAELYEYKGPGEKDPLRLLIEDDLGLETQDMGGGGVVLKGQVTRDYDHFGEVFGKEARKQLAAFYAKCAELMPLEKYAHRWQPDNDHPWADKTFRECLEEEVSDPAARAYVEAAAASDLATESHTCNGLNGIKNVLLDNDDYMQLYHVRGGIGRVAEGLAVRIEAEFRTNCRVTGLAKGGKKYRLAYREGDEEKSDDFDAVIVALPNHWLTQLDWGDEKFSDALRDMLAHYDLPAHYLRVSVLFSENWWKQHGMPGDFFMWDGFNGCCVYDESHRWGHEKSHVLSFLLAGQDALNMRAANQRDGDVVEHVLSSLPEPMRADARRAFLEGRVDSYVGSINAQPGGWPAEELEGEHQPEPDGHPGVFVTGDYLFDSTLNGCLISASVAVNLLAKQLGLKTRKGSPAVEQLVPDGAGLSLAGGD